MLPGNSQAGKKSCACSAGKASRKKSKSQTVKSETDKKYTFQLFDFPKLKINLKITRSYGSFRLFEIHKDTFSLFGFSTF